VIAAAVLAAYANAMGAAFQFDDWNVIVDQPRVAGLAAWWASMPGIRPLLKLSYALDNAAGWGATGFHAVNIAIHLTNAWLVFALFARAGRAAQGAAPQGAAPRATNGRATRFAAFAGALVFALHPVQTESVTYVSGRSNALMALLALASILAWSGGGAPFAGRAGLVADGPFAPARLASAALFAAALLVKETAAVLPLALLLLAVTVFPERRARSVLPHVAVLGAAACAAIASPTYRRLFATSLEARGTGANLLTQAHGVVYLMGQVVRLDRLNADPMLRVFESWSPRLAFDAAIIVALLAVGVASIRRRPPLACGILWFFVWLLPTNSLLPRLDVVNDRQLYMALAGPAWFAACAVGAVAARRRSMVALAPALALAVALGAATHARNRVYADEVGFWEDVARKSPHNGRALNNLGYALALASRTDEAEAAFLGALALDPADVRAAINLRLLREGALVPARPR
jgi:hypothetical protein